MTKIQRNWFTVFCLAFLTPELLWSPILSFYYLFFEMSKVNGSQTPLRANFITGGHYDILWKLILYFQLFCLIGAIYVLNKSSLKNKFLKIGIITILVLLALITFLPAIYHFGL